MRQNFDRELQILMHENNKLKENEQLVLIQLQNCKEQRKAVNLADHRDYEDRVRGLLQEIEQMSKDHMMTLSEVQDRVTEGLSRESDLKTKLK